MLERGSMDKSLFERIKEERKRLRLTQQQVANSASVTRETWSRYESGKISPGTDVWIALAKAGADINYIITGERIIIEAFDEILSDSVAENQGSYDVDLKLTKRELALISYFRKVNEETKQSIENVAKLLVQKKNTD